MKKVLSVFGTRPEVIKLAPIMMLLDSNPEFKHISCATAQHRELLDDALAAFNLSPDIDLDIMKQDQSLHSLTSSVILGLGEVISGEKPDVVLVHGDTTTSMGAALAAFYLGSPIAHVEAGLRTHDLHAPFPEELNRQITGKIATWHFAPTEKARQNLLAEGTNDNQIWVTGNTVVDALNLTIKRLECDELLRDNIGASLDASVGYVPPDKPLVLITGHRRENFDGGLFRICEAIRILALAYPEVSFIYSMHPNPNVMTMVQSQLSGLGNVRLVHALAYLEFVLLMNKCLFILTDSGGIQEEALVLRKPVLVLRDKTERSEGLTAGGAMLVGSKTEDIVLGATRILENRSEVFVHEVDRWAYGDGFAAQRIIRELTRQPSTTS
jgi:UDP-N-acetylglucosamine 2-epimerase (non-hydrolysing)